MGLGCHFSLGAYICGTTWRPNIVTGSSTFLTSPPTAWQEIRRGLTEAPRSLPLIVKPGPAPAQPGSRALAAPPLRCPAGLPPNHLLNIARVAALGGIGRHHTTLGTVRLRVRPVFPQSGNLIWIPTRPMHCADESRVRASCPGPSPPARQLGVAGNRIPARTADTPLATRPPDFCFFFNFLLFKSLLFIFFRIGKTNELLPPPLHLQGLNHLAR